MKNILVPTDFSACATLAVTMGVALAEFFGAALHLFTSMDDTRNGEAFDRTLLENSPEGRRFLENANVLFENWKKEARFRGVELKTICAPGKLVAGIQNYVSKNNIDFIVMGSHGMSGMNELFMGSNTQKVVRSLHIPVFVIKHPVQNYKFDNIVYASNFEMNEKDVFLKFLNFIEKFSPQKIHLLAINTLGWYGQPFSKMEESMERFKEMCSFTLCHTHLIENPSVEEGIQEFAENVEADLVVISNHNRHRIKRMFSGSNVEALINHCHIPVLSIDFADKNSNVKLAL